MSATDAVAPSFAGIPSLADTINDLLRVKDQAIATIQRQKAQIAELQAALAAAQTNTAALAADASKDAVIEGLQLQVAGLETQTDEQNAEIARLKKAAEEAAAADGERELAVAGMETELDELRAARQTDATTISELQSALQAARQEGGPEVLAQLNAQLAACQAEIQEKTAGIAQWKAWGDSMRTNYTTLTNQVTELTEKSNAAAAAAAQAAERATAEAYSSGFSDGKTREAKRVIDDIAGHITAITDREVQPTEAGIHEAIAALVRPPVAPSPTRAVVHQNEEFLY